MAPILSGQLSQKMASGLACLIILMDIPRRFSGGVTGYVWNEEPQPELIVTGERLGRVCTPASIVSRATNA